jgi:hypothetical protein
MLVGPPDESTGDWWRTLRWLCNSSQATAISIGHHLLDIISGGRYVAYALSLRNLEEIMQVQERGGALVDHSTIHR